MDPVEKSNLRIWGDIPDGSKLEIGVSPVDEPNFVARGWLVHHDNREEQWTNSQLRPGPITPKPKIWKNQHCIVRLALFFSEMSEAKVTAVVVDPKGNVVKPYMKHTFPGHKNEVVRITFVLLGEVTNGTEEE